MVSSKLYHKRGAYVVSFHHDSNIKDNYKKGNKTFFNELPPKSIESTLFHGSGDYFVLAPINTNLAPN